MTIAIPKPDKTSSARRRLAKGVCVKLQLPLDDSLAHVIGNGTESTSEAAVSHWLAELGADPFQTSLQEACNALLRDLSDRLDV